MADCRLTAKRHGNGSSTGAAVRVVTQGTLVGNAGTKSAQCRAPGRRIADDRADAGRIAARPPPAGRVFDVSIKDIAFAEQTERDAIGRSPFVDCARVKEANQNVKLPA